MEKSPGMPLQAPLSQPCMGAVRTGAPAPPRSPPFPAQVLGAALG